MMIRLLKGLWLFYQKLIIPSLVLSIILGSGSLLISGTFSLGTTAIAYLVSSLLFLYFIYEIRRPREYYFYHNLGLSKSALWIGAFILSGTISLILLQL